jgi:hypothetical protein
MREGMAPSPARRARELDKEHAEVTRLNTRIAELEAANTAWAARCGAVEAQVAAARGLAFREIIRELETINFISETSREAEWSRHIVRFIERLAAAPEIPAKEKL